MDTLRRAELLPKSGIGVVAPWLVIAPPGNPVIRIDLRLLDRVELIGKADIEGDDGGEGDAAETGSSDERRDVLLVCGDLEVALVVADGPEAAARIAAEALPWTREHGGEEKPLPTALARDRTGPASFGRLVVMSSTPDAEVCSDDELAGYVYELTEPVMRVGRTDDNHIIIKHRSISGDHAKVTRDADTGRYTLTDLHASNGLRVNGDRGIGVELEDGDIVDLGQVRMRFVAPGEAVEDEWDAPACPDLEEYVFVGDDAVIHSGDRIKVGSLAFRIDEVQKYALRGANLPLTRGGLLQAAMALLVVAAHAREADRLD